MNKNSIHDIKYTCAAQSKLCVLSCPAGFCVEEFPLGCPWDPSMTILF